MTVFSIFLCNFVGKIEERFLSGANRMTEKEKMLAGEIYSAVDPQLLEELTEVKEIIHDYNLLRPSEVQKGKMILKGVHK